MYASLRSYSVVPTSEVPDARLLPHVTFNPDALYWVGQDLGRRPAEDRGFIARFNLKPNPPARGERIIGHYSEFGRTGSISVMDILEALDWRDPRWDPDQLDAHASYHLNKTVIHEYAHHIRRYRPMEVLYRQPFVPNFIRRYVLSPLIHRPVDEIADRFSRKYSVAQFTGSAALRTTLGIAARPKTRRR